MNHANIQIGTFNCHGFSGSLDYVIELVGRCDVLCLNETWIRVGDEGLIEATLKQSSELRNCNITVFSKSGMEDAEPDYTGRPFGGVAIVCRQSKNINYQPIPVPCERIAAVGIHDASGTLRQIVVSIYMPFYCPSNPESINGYIRTLEALQSIMDKYGACAPICIAGDFNAQLPRSQQLSRTWYRSNGFTPLSNLLYQFCEHNDLIAADLAVSQPIQWTYHSESLGHRSWIDHMLISREASASLTSCHISPTSPRNVSDHLPITATARVPIVLDPASPAPFRHSNSRPQWKNGATRQLYSELLSQKISAISPLSLDDCNAEEKQEITDVFFDAVITAMHSAAQEAGCHPNKNHKPKSWWCPELSRLRDGVRFWRGIWSEMGRPRAGHTFECYKATKKAYRRLCRCCVADVEFSRNNELNSLLLQRKTKAFWNAIRRCQQPRINSSLAAEDLAKHYASTMRRSSADLSPQHREISRIVSEHERAASGRHSPPLLMESVTHAIASLRLDSSPGFDGISTEHVRYGASSDLHRALLTAYEGIFRHGIVPRIFNVGVIIPVIKKPTLNANDCTNYRPITLSCTFAKLAEALVSLQHTPADTQFGFRQGRCTAQAVSIIHDTVKIMNHADSPVFLATLDAEKCFDRIWHDGLFYKLIGLVPDHQWVFLRRWYGSLSAAVRWKGHLSREFRVTQGTRQGSLLSPALFNVFIDDLLTGLSSSVDGVRINNMVLNSVVYADDVTLMASTMPALQRLIDICFRYAQEWRFAYGVKKSACMVAGRYPYARPPEWKLGNSPIQVVEELEILGVTLCSNGNADRHAANRMQRCHKAFYGLGHAGIMSAGLHPRTKVYLWKTMCCPALVYGSDAIHLPPRVLRALESEQGSLVKRSLRLGKRSRHSALLLALDIERVECLLQKRTAALLDRILFAPSPARQLHLTLLAKFLASGSTTPGTLLSRLKTWQVSAVIPAVPAAGHPPVVSDGTVDSIKGLIMRENFIKPYSDELVLLRLLTRSF
jgi:exonuclease III